MRTTIDLPESLWRQAKARAALDGTTLKELVTRFVQQGLQRSTPPSGTRRQRSAIPTIQRTGGPAPALSNADLADLLEQDDLARENRIRGPS